jgi:hypothetical protein
MTPPDERRNRRIQLPLSTARVAVAALVLTAIGMPVAWAGGALPTVGAQPTLAPTPTYVNATEGVGPIDTKTSPVICWTTEFSPTGKATARMDSWVTLSTGGVALVFEVWNAISTDAGASWQNVDSVAAVGSTHGISGGYGDQSTAGNSAIVDLTPGTTYTFGVRVRGGGGGQSDPGAVRCEVLVEITHDSGPPGPVEPPSLAPPVTP